MSLTVVLLLLLHNCCWLLLLCSLSVTCRPAWAWALLSWLSILLYSSCAVATANSTLNLQFGRQQAAHCKLDILGGDNGTLQHASMECSGPTKHTVSLHSTFLGSFTANFTGVSLVATASCNSSLANGAPCLITLCSGAIALHDSIVSLVRDIRVRGLVCVTYETMLEVHNSSFSDNHVRPFNITDEAIVVFHNSAVSNNVMNASSGGLSVFGNAHVTIADGSRVQGTAAYFGGGGMVVAECTCHPHEW